MRVGIIGGNGYVGSELIRWLLLHPSVELALVAGRSQAGVPVGEAVPGLLGLTDLLIQPIEAVTSAGLDAVLLATPHGVARGLIDGLAKIQLLIDLSADHRHAPGWTYAQPEWCAAAIRGSHRLAAPGCFATAISLALAPLVKAGVLRGEVQVCGMTGSTGSGASPSAGTHHPERFANLKAYKVLSHQHVPEVEAFLAGLGAAPKLRFVPVSAPVDRGILATCFTDVGEGVDAAAIVREAYAGAPLVRWRKDSPEIRLTRGTSFCDLSVTQDGACAVVLSAIDNLGRGASAQAVQILNLAAGLPAETGLRFPPATP